MGETIELGEHDCAIVFRYVDNETMNQEIIIAIPEDVDDNADVPNNALFTTILGVMIKTHDPEFVELVNRKTLEYQSEIGKGGKK